MTIIRLGALAVLGWLVVVSPVAAQGFTPEETVRQYLEAMQAQNFETAWELSSESMRGGKPKEVWARERQYMFQLSETKIFGYEVFPGEVQDDTAKVPNILSSQDKFLNQLGVEEHELYTLLKEDGEWKVDQQEIVIDREGLKKWFPEDEMPEQETTPASGGDAP